MSAAARALNVPLPGEDRDASEVRADELEKGASGHLPELVLGRNASPLLGHDVKTVTVEKMVCIDANP